MKWPYVISFRARCTLGMNHDTDAESHDAGEDKLCEYQSSYGNKVFMCKVRSVCNIAHTCSEIKLLQSK